MTYSSEVLADSPRLYYRLGESSGTTMVDSSGNGHDGTYDATVTLGAAGALAGDSDTAVTFPGGTVNAQVPLGTTLSGISATVSIEGWFKTTNTGAGTIASRWGSSVAAGQTVIIDLQSSNVIRAYARVGGATVIASATITGLRDGNWHHAVGTYDGANVRLYVDGTVRATTAATGTLDTSGTEGFTVGSRGASQQFLTGSVDEAALYTSALSDARVLAHYDAGITAPVTPTATLAGTLRAKTAAFTALVSAEASLSGTLGAKTATFTAATVLAASLAGTVQPKTAAFTADVAATVANAQLAGTLQPKTAALTAFTQATATLGGTLQAKTGAFSADVVAGYATLAGTLQPKTAAFTAAGMPAAQLAATLRRKTSVITVVSNPAARLAATLRRKTAAFIADAQPTAILAGSLQRKLGTFSVYVVTPVTPAPLPTAGISVVAASAFGAVTIEGTQAVYSVSTATIPRARQQIVVDGIDITYFRDVPTPDVTPTLIEPLLYGPARLELPQVAMPFEHPGEGALSFLRPGAPVEVHLVVDDVVTVRNYYKGVVVAHDPSGRNLSVELGGEISGRAAMRNRQVPIFKRINDLGRQVYDAVHDLGIPMLPYLGPVTGIEVMTSGGTGHDEHIQERLAMAWTRAGRQWTCMPDEFGVYRMTRKDDTTIHGTVFVDDARTVANLRRDISEEPNRIFVTCVTPAGQRVRFGVYPGLIQGPVPDFPGHMQEGDTGEGVRLLIGRLHATGWIKLEDTPGGYDLGIYKAVEWFQDESGLNVTGEVNEATWNALWDLDLSGTSLEWAHIEPAAQRRKVRQWDRSGSGTILGLNPLYEPDHLVRDRNIDLGAGVTRDQAREFARTVLNDSDTANWVGAITFHTGALVRGDGFQGMTMTEPNVMDARELRPGMNLDLPQFGGGILVHVSACEVDGDGIVTATVDTRFRDALEVWEIIARNKESRNDPSRSRNRKYRSSTILKDSIGEWDEIGGYLGNDIPLKAGWNVFQIVAAAEGTVSRFKYTLADPAESACAVFGSSVDEGWLNGAIPEPLTTAGEKMWRTKRDELDDRVILYSAGTKDQPCGYSPGMKSDDDALTGKHVDDAGFAYRSESRTLLHVAVWVAEENLLNQGRIMWNQLESGA